MFYVLRRLIHFLSGISASVIKWPSDLEKNEIERHFREKGFPGVIGAIDGTHIKINKPEADPDSYLNRKHFHSIQVSISLRKNYYFIKNIQALNQIRHGQ